MFLLARQQLLARSLVKLSAVDACFCHREASVHTAFVVVCINIDIRLSTVSRHHDPHTIIQIVRYLPICRPGGRCRPGARNLLFIVRNLQARCLACFIRSADSNTFSISLRRVSCLVVIAPVFRSVTSTKPFDTLTTRNCLSSSWSHSNLRFAALAVY